LTYEHIAAIVGHTRQWVTQSMDQPTTAGPFQIARSEVIIHSLESLKE